MIYDMRHIGTQQYDDRYQHGAIWLSGSDEMLDIGDGRKYQGPAIVTVVIDREDDDKIIVTSLSEHEWTEQWMAAGEPDMLLLGV